MEVNFFGSYLTANKYDMNHICIYVCIQQQFNALIGKSNSNETNLCGAKKLEWLRRYINLSIYVGMYLSILKWHTNFYGCHYLRLTLLSSHIYNLARFDSTNSCLGLVYVHMYAYSQTCENRLPLSTPKCKCEFV